MTRAVFVLVAAFAIGFLGIPAAASAKGALLVVDAGTGRTLQATNADAPRYPASLTKMMTLYLLFDEVNRGKKKLSSRLTVSRHAASMPPTKLGLRPGAKITVRDAILALVTKSANDIAVVVAEALAGSESRFARRMTSKARALGMKRTTFRNASGLHHPQQKTTARDMATLARALLRNHSRFYPLFATKTFVYGKSRYGNHNRLLYTYDGVDGIKTGFTQPSGYNLVASAKRGNVRLIGVVLGSSSSAARNATMAKLLDRGFERAPADRAVAAKSRARRSAGARTRLSAANVSSPVPRPAAYVDGRMRDQVMLGPPNARPARGAAAPSG